MTMAQPSSVQREPSMEEILASIRRIIEDNETSRKDEKSASQSASYQARDVTTARSDASGANEPASPSSPRAEMPKPTATPADAPIANPLDFLNDVVSIQPAAKPDVSFTELSASAKRSEPAASAALSEPSVAAPEAGEPRMNVEEPKTATPQKAADTSMSDETASHQPIVSEKSERKIASAFSELAEAYEASRRKSLAEAAEEMLRPMLREWIDENLPQMVERLVREEIERIARKS
jgi:cell pole-organizing protein PopZ